MKLLYRSKQRVAARVRCAVHTPRYHGERQFGFSEAVLLFQHTGEVTSGDLQKMSYRPPLSSLRNVFEIHLTTLLTGKVV